MVVSPRRGLRRWKSAVGSRAIHLASAPASRQKARQSLDLPKCQVCGGYSEGSWSKLQATAAFRDRQSSVHTQMRCLRAMPSPGAVLTAKSLENRPRPTPVQEIDSKETDSRKPHRHSNKVDRRRAIRADTPWQIGTRSRSRHSRPGTNPLTRPLHPTVAATAAVPSPLTDSRHSGKLVQIGQSSLYGRCVCARRAARGRGLSVP